VAKKLTKLRVTEVSIVDRAANPGARIMLMKRDVGELPRSPTPAPIIKEQPMQTAIYKRREIVEIAKAFAETGEIPVEITKADVYGAMVRSAEKNRLPGQSAAQAFARYVESPEGMSMYRLHKAAGGADHGSARPVFSNAYDAEMWARQDHIRKARDDAADRRQVVESSIAEMVDQMMDRHPGMTRDAARRRVLQQPHVQAMLRGGRPIVDRAQAG
jgi:hypothetical protein